MLFVSNTKHCCAAGPMLTSLQPKQEEGNAAAAKVNEVLTTGILHKNVDQQIVVVVGGNRTKSEEVAEAMKKLDETLLAYLVGEELPEKEPPKLSVEQLEIISPIKQLTDSVTNDDEAAFRQQQVDLYRAVNGIKLAMEALTLEAEGTKRMELLQREVRPIFTVECNLSYELIKHVPRYDMFNIMQFESEKFQSLTQCTRFGQEAEREIHFLVDENDVKNANDIGEVKLHFGRINFAVWWREPGTCLNEMLGMGVLELEELYNSALLEQCKCVTIKRRGVHLASVYLKLSLQLPQEYFNIGTKLCQELSLGEECSDGNKKKGHQKQRAKQTKPEAKRGGGEEKPTTTGDVKNDGNTATGDNNNSQVKTSNFPAETSKIRVLEGLLCVREAQNLKLNTDNYNYIIACHCFWQERDGFFVTPIGKDPNDIGCAQQFTVLNNEKFLSDVQNKFVTIDIWKYKTKSGDPNGLADINTSNVVGRVNLPLHKFFVAYKDEDITLRLCKGALPVVACNEWMPIKSYGNCNEKGLLNCILAIGTKEQINNLKLKRQLTERVDQLAARAFDLKFCSEPKFLALMAYIKYTFDKLRCAFESKCGPSCALNGCPVAAFSAALTTVPLPRFQTLPPVTSFPALQTSTAVTSSARPTPLRQFNVKTFKMTLDIQRATGLPANPPPKVKRPAKRNTKKKQPPNEPPSFYVTFQAEESNSPLFNSHEGCVYATHIFEKSTSPQWLTRFRIAIQTEYLTNPQLNFILRVWKKSPPDPHGPAGSRLKPTPLEDAIIGFIALQLSPLLNGAYIGGWFTIMDYHGRSNGQLEVHCQPLEDVTRFAQAEPVPANNPQPTSAEDASIDELERALDLSNTDLSESVKNKMCELQEISDRLRTRLERVTGEELAESLYNDMLEGCEPLDDNADTDEDTLISEFEHDLNTDPATSAQNDVATQAQVSTPQTTDPSGADDMQE